MRLRRVHKPTGLRLAFDFDGLYRSLGSIAVHTTWLEHELEETVTELAGSVAVAYIVRGQRGSNTIAAAKRLLDENVVSPDDTAAMRELLRRAGKAIDLRDKLIHSVWAKTNSCKPDHILATRTRASGQDQDEWSLAGLEAVRADLERLQIDLGVITHNAVADKRGWAKISTD